MYVCICNAYRESDVARAAKAGARSVDEAYRALGAGPCCGKCVDVAERLIDEVRGDRVELRLVTNS